MICRSLGTGELLFDSASVLMGSIIKEVVLELSPDKTQEDILPRNLTLILKSEKPVKWIIKSQGIKGQLVIAAGNNEVEHLSKSPEQDIDIRHTVIPDAFESLIKEVTSSYGLPLSYVRVHQANLLEMTIPPRSKRGKDDDFFFKKICSDSNISCLQKSQAYLS